jgi:hypothetical protein
MASKILHWIIGFALKFLGLERIPEKKKDLEKKAEEAVEQIRGEQEDMKAKKQDKWDKATDEEKQTMLLDRFNDNDSRD